MVNFDPAWLSCPFNFLPPARLLHPRIFGQNSDRICESRKRSAIEVVTNSEGSCKKIWFASVRPPSYVTPSTVLIACFMMRSRAVPRRVYLALCGNTLEIQHTTTTPRQVEQSKARPGGRARLPMERLLSKTKTSNTDFFSDPSHRMSQRPSIVKSGEGIGFQELGSSFGPPKPVVTYGGSYKSKSKLPYEPRKVPPSIEEDESDDELLLLSSQPSTGGDATSSSKRVVKAKKHDIPSDEEESVHVNGRTLPAHPDYKPSSFNALKVLRFTKNKKNAPSGNVDAEVPPPSSPVNDSQELSKPISDDIEVLDHSPGGPSRPSGSSSTRRRSPSTTRTGAQRFSDAKDAPTPKPTSPTAKDTSRPLTKPRPKPRVIIKSAPRHRDSSPESTPRPAERKRGFPLRNKTPEKPANLENKRSVKKPVNPSSSRREPQEFPMSLQAKENVSDGAWSGDASSSKTKKAVISRAATIANTPKPIPLPSPLKTKPVSRTTTFPNLSPLTSSRDKGKARAPSPDEVEVNLTDGQEKRSGPQPFPMSSQMLAGIDRRSKSPSLKSTKRASSDDSGAEQGRTAKKHKDSRLEYVSLTPSSSAPHVSAVQGVRPVRLFARTHGR